MRIVVALGGNALGNNWEEQRQRVAQVAPVLAGLLGEGEELVLTHGNGPQVGRIKLALDSDPAAAGEFPLAECTAMSQGYIGYHLQSGLQLALAQARLQRQVVTLLTRVVVAPEDPAFADPQKPIGAFYSREEAEKRMAAEPGAVFRQDAGRGWRRMVASPQPRQILEKEAINDLLQQGMVVIACGGGGIPVFAGQDGEYASAPAVVDKDLAAALLAREVDAALLLILTAVPRVCKDFGKPTQTELAELSVTEARELAEQGQFAPGSMLPKINAAIGFCQGRPERRCIIAQLEQAAAALKGEAGTLIRDC